jgi:dihydrofolate synthase / folylpolyglutamate synthase
MFTKYMVSQTSMVDLDTILTPWQRAGMSLGLERIQALMTILANPQDKIPVVHVAGSNGKGSVCAYLSTILATAGYRVGRYTSPHLVDWNERICINNQPIATDRLTTVLQNVQAKSPEPLTKFELITAAAWSYFASEEVDIAIMEVGLGGRLDATNTVRKPLVSVITSISREHWQQLGETIPEIAGEKAGIIKLGCPVVIGQLPIDATQVITQRAQALQAPCTQITPAIEINPGQAQVGDLIYSLPLLGDIQLHNSALAIEVINQLTAQGWQISPAQIQAGIANTQWLGRMHQTEWQGQKLLVDGAHNPESAIALRNYVDRWQQPVTWVIGMLNTKEHLPILQALLRPDDQVHLVPVPEDLTATPAELMTVVRSIYSDMAAQTYGDWPSGLTAAYAYPLPVVMSGSLYLLGDFYRLQRKPFKS